MPGLGAVLAGIATALAAAAALGATGEEIYKAKCGLCHDSGAAAAPRINDPAPWVSRLAQGKEPVYQTALKGKPDTAMLPKGGFPELSDADVRAAVDYMLVHSGYRDAPAGTPRDAARAETVAAAAPAPERRVGPVDDRTIVADVAAALLKARDVSPLNAQLETYEGVTSVRGTGIKIEARDGVVTLRGMVEQAGVIARAEAIARTIGGVKAVDNKLIASSLFEHD
jgi:cytochrome c5